MMKKIRLVSLDNVPFTASLPDPVGDNPSVYFFAYHKSGSTLMENMVVTYARHYGRPTFSLYEEAFHSGVPTHRTGKDAKTCFVPQGMIYTGFRHYPPFKLDLADQVVCLLVRDPRDMLVSMYYSVLKSHIIPKGHKSLQNQREEAKKVGIDEFVRLRAPGLLYKHNEYVTHLGSETVTCYRYEDVIYEKEEWLADMVEKCRIPVNRDIVRKVANEFDIIPKKERQDKHIRQVHPGNHKLKLRADTIEFLNDCLKPFLSRYNYL